MFDTVEDLMFDEEYDYAYESSYFDDQNMMVDIAIESFSYIDPYADSFDDDLEFVYASEALMDAIEEDLYAINTEFYIATESSSGNKTGIFQKIKNSVAKVLNGLKTFCLKRADKWGRKYPKVGKWWRARAKQCENIANKLRGVKTEEQLQQVKQETEELQQETSEVAKKENSEVAKHDSTVPKPGNTSRLGDGVSRPPVNAASYQNKHNKNPNNNGFNETISRAQDKAAANSIGTPKISRINNPENNLENLEKNVVASPNNGFKQTKRIKEIDEQIEHLNKHKPEGWVREITLLNKEKMELNHKAPESFTSYDFDPDYGYVAEGYVVYDYETGYEIAVEGLFSKPKTAEQLLERVQKKVNKLKTIGACDDMLRQLDAEAKNFNGAMVALKKANAEFQKTNDKKTFKRTAGPVLKDLNKRCKILNIKNIASDPKNITQEEIKKFRDFITGSKQLINARKKVLKGGVTESMSYFDEDNNYEVPISMESDMAMESFIMTDPRFDGYDYIVAESALLMAIESDLYAIDSEIEYAMESDGENTSFKQKIGNAVSKIFEGLARICEKRIKRWKGVDRKKEATWTRRFQMFMNKAERLKGNISKEELKEANKAAKAAEKFVKDQVAREEKINNAINKGELEYPSDANSEKGKTTVSGEKLNKNFISTDAYLADFSDADRMIALATEGIINPDFKRAHRIKFGEKKRQIKGVLKRARAARKAKDFAAAIALYQEAKKGYSGLMAEAKKLPNYTTSSGKSKLGANKTGLINWCISKMSECDNAIEAIKNGQMKSARKAAAKESYYDDMYGYDSAIENMYGYEDDDPYDVDYEDDDYDEYSGSIESLLM